MDSFHLSNIELSKTSLNINCCFQISLMCFPVISCWLFWRFPILHPSHHVLFCFPSTLSCSNANNIKCYREKPRQTFWPTQYFEVLEGSLSLNVVQGLFCVAVLFLCWSSMLVAGTIFPEFFYARFWYR